MIDRNKICSSLSSEQLQEFLVRCWKEPNLTLKKIAMLAAAYGLEISLKSAKAFRDTTYERFRASFEKRRVCAEKMQMLRAQHEVRGKDDPVADEVGALLVEAVFDRLAESDAEAELDLDLLSRVYKRVSSIRQATNELAHRQECREVKTCQWTIDEVKKLKQLDIVPEKLTEQEVINQLRVRVFGERPVRMVEIGSKAWYSEGVDQLTGLLKPGWEMVDGMPVKIEKLPEAEAGAAAAKVEAAAERESEESAHAEAEAEACEEVDPGAEGEVKAEAETQTEAEAQTLAAVQTKTGAQSGWAAETRAGAQTECQSQNEAEALVVAGAQILLEEGQAEAKNEAGSEGNEAREAKNKKGEARKAEEEEEKADEEKQSMAPNGTSQPCRTGHSQRADQPRRTDQPGGAGQPRKPADVFPTERRARKTASRKGQPREVERAAARKICKGEVPTRPT